MTQVRRLQTGDLRLPRFAGAFLCRKIPLSPSKRRREHTPHSPTPARVLAVHGAAGAKANPLPTDDGEPSPGLFDQRTESGRPVEIPLEDGSLLVLDSDCGHGSAPHQSPLPKQCLAKRRGCSCSKTTLERMNLATTESHPRKSGSRSSTGSLLHPFSTPHSPTPVRVLAVRGAAGAKVIS